MSMQVGIKLANLDTALYVFHELQLYFIGMKCQRCKEIDVNVGIVFGALVEDFSMIERKESMNLQHHSLCFPRRAADHPLRYCFSSSGC
jgi:hypothetical protein